MWTAALTALAALIGLVSKFVGGGSSTPTAGDQKAADEAAAVQAGRKLQEVQSKPDNTKADLDAGKF